MKKLTERHLQILALGCGILLVVYGVTKEIVGFDWGEQVERWITSGLFIGAALAYLQIFKLRREARDASKKP